jgi:hypothetical protein
MPLAEWESRFDLALREIPDGQRKKAGSVLSVIPAHDEWDRLVTAIRQEWRHWECEFALKPACLVVLYDGVAFYNYRSGAFWKGFADVVAATDIPANIQAVINHRFMAAASRFDLRVEHGNFVGSAVAHIGVPISMWDGFLHVCEWALWTDGWEGLSDEEWRSAIMRRLGGQVRLIKFLLENRHTATQFIRDMLDARRILAEDRNLTVSGIAQASILRPEYFDEVPETADFLRPDNPESLFADRGRLAWSEERRSISLHLPPVSRDLLPAVWRLDEQEQPANAVASELPLHGKAFAKTLRLEFAANGKQMHQRINGIEPFALYDEARLRFVNHYRDLLPVSQYTLISRHPLTPKLEGWQQDPEEPCVDLQSHLADGTPIFLTKLFAESRRPKLKIGDCNWIHFAQRRSVALRIFFGHNQATAALLSVAADGIVRTELLPRPFLEVPLSLVRDDDIPTEFTVFLDGQTVRGRWRTFDYDPPNSTEENAERAFCFWQWEESQIPQPLNWLGLHTLHVQSRRLGRLMFGSRSECRFELLQPGRSNLWPTAWGDYMAWVLLSQVQVDATWEEVRIAREAVAMFANINLSTVYYQIRKLERHGFLVARGHKYRDFRSRIKFMQASSGAYVAEYCGLTSSLYEITKKVPPIRITVAPSEPSCPAKLLIEWAQRERDTVRSACQQQRIEIVQRLWNR